MVLLTSSLAFATPPHPWQQSVTIDYSAANEYMDAHYKHILPDGESYFDAPTTEDIFNARQGYIADDERGGTTGLIEPSLERCGFALVQLKEEESARSVSDWTDMGQITSRYLPQLRKAIGRAFDSNTENGGSISHMLFYQPMLRGEKVEMGTMTSPIASLVHIDTDVGAHDVEGIVRLVERNQIRDGEDDKTTFPRKEVIDAINKGARFAIVNAWRGVNSGGTPVGRAHLGLFSPQYDTSDSDHPSSSSLPRRHGHRHRCRHRCYPALRPKRPQSRWYVFPQMDHDEVLLFKQYDRRVDRISDIWHCSLPVFPGEEESSSRISFDCRALVIFDNELLPEEIDRYCDDRMRPSLTLDESGCFCDEQAKKRRD